MITMVMVMIMMAIMMMIMRMKTICDRDVINERRINVKVVMIM